MLTVSLGELASRTARIRESNRKGAREWAWGWGVRLEESRHWTTLGGTKASPRRLRNVRLSDRQVIIERLMDLRQQGDGRRQRPSALVFLNLNFLINNFEMFSFICYYFVFFSLLFIFYLYFFLYLF